MPAPTAERLGRGPCPHCAETITFRRSSGGKLTWRCDACESSGYAEQGGPAFTALMAQITKAAASPEPSGTPAPKPTPNIRDASRKPPTSVFELGNL
jgi:hypothetical protein